jgi:outer membrane protein assembly factor BamB
MLGPGRGARLRRLALGALVLAAGLLPGKAARANDWPMLAGNPQRTGRTEEGIEFPYEFAWEARFEPERLSLKCQPVIAGGRLFIGTKSGNLYALDARTGRKVWKYAAGGPIEHTAAVAGGKVFTGCLDGTLHAVTCATGRRAWVFQAESGFTASPLPVAGKVFIGSRAGVLYALNQADGKVIWKRNLGAPIFNSAAYDQGRIFLGVEDMRIRCLDAGTGRVIWTSARLYGQSFRQYYPVISQGKVLANVMGTEGIRYMLYRDGDWTDENTIATGAKISEETGVTALRRLVDAQ